MTDKLPAEMVLNVNESFIYSGTIDGWVIIFNITNKKYPSIVSQNQISQVIYNLALTENDNYLLTTHVDKVNIFKISNIIKFELVSTY